MAKRIIECQVNDEYVVGAGVVVGAAGSHDDVVLRLTFNDMWIGLNVYATFRNANGESPTLVPIPASRLVDGEVRTYDVPIPAEAKRYKGKMMLTLTGYSLVDGVEEDRATNTATAYFRVLESDFALFDDGTITPTLAQQMLDEVNNIHDYTEREIAAHKIEVGESLAAQDKLAADRHNQLCDEIKKESDAIDDKLTAQDEVIAEAKEFIEKRAASLDGFEPVSPAPLWDSGADIKKTMATVTDVTEAADGSHIVRFNHTEEYFPDGGFEQYDEGESLVYLDSVEKNENGWTGLFFDGENRTATVVPASNGGSHSGNAYLKVKGSWSSLCRTVKLEPRTDYVFSFWQKGTKDTMVSNITIASKAEDGNIIYRVAKTADGSDTYIRDEKNPRYDIRYNKGEERLKELGASLNENDVWQKFECRFFTHDYEYVDIYLYFGNYSNSIFYFDDFSITKVLGDEFDASYAAGVEVPSEVTVGSVFYVERDNGRTFTRFEHVSSYAIKELFKCVEGMSKSTSKGDAGVTIGSTKPDDSVGDDGDLFIEMGQMMYAKVDGKWLPALPEVPVYEGETEVSEWKL